MSRKRKTNRMGLGTLILLIICLIVFCGSGYYLADYFLKAWRAQNQFSDLQARQGESRDLLTEKGVVIGKYADLYKENNDLIGWVEIKGTRINYPVMQTKDEGDDPEFYLHRDFRKEYSESGTPFMDAASDIFIPTSNWLVYGHHMKSGIMFHDLVEYDSKDFFEEHPEFRFDTIYKGGQGTYRVIAACYSKIYPEDSSAFKFYQYAGITSEEKFNEYVAGVKSLSLYDTGETAEYGDQLVTLSTCSYQTKEGRFFIVGKRIDQD